MLHGAAPRQWEHYPTDDAISRGRRYQWFYHSHSPEDRPDSTEHGHFHLFARMEGVAKLIDAYTEKRFLRKLDVDINDASTRHLLCIGISPVGLPISLFTVNRWVTGDLLLSGAATLRLLQQMKLVTGYPLIDKCVAALIQLYAADIRALIARRDHALRARAAGGPGTLDDVTLEVLSELQLNVDQRIATTIRPASRERAPGTTQAP